MTVVAVGRQRRSPWEQAWRVYADRLSRPPLGPLLLREVELRPSLPAAEARVREGELLLAALPQRAVVVALDERGDMVDSAGFADRIADWRDDGVPDLAFLIGGADGLSDAVRARADRILSFGPMTWPHLLVRVMLAEQLYRARTILDGHPYHRA